VDGPTIAPRCGYIAFQIASYESADLMLNQSKALQVACQSSISSLGAIQ